MKILETDSFRESKVAGFGNFLKSFVQNFKLQLNEFDNQLANRQIGADVQSQLQSQLQAIEQQMRYVAQELNKYPVVPTQ